MESIYSWEGKLNRDEELLLMIKSRAALVPALTAAVKGLHPYTECEARMLLPLPPPCSPYVSLGGASLGPQSRAR